MTASGQRWLVLLLLFASLGCHSMASKDDGSKSRRGIGMVGDEAYMLPPLSAFEPFPAEIETDILTRFANAGLNCTTLKRSKGVSRQSVYAGFSAGLDAGRDTVLQAFALMGHNFSDVARVVLEFPGPEGPRYYIASGTRLNEYLGQNLDSQAITLSADDFWATLEYEITPENPAEHPDTERKAFTRT